MSAYETRDSIRDSRARLLAEHKDAAADWQRMAEAYETRVAALTAEVVRCHLAMRCRDDATLWQVLRQWWQARGPIGGKATKEEKAQ